MEGVKYVVTGDLTLGGERTAPYIDDAITEVYAETWIMLLAHVAPICLIKKRKFTEEIYNIISVSIK